ncbi:BrnT family toxin [Glaciimonas sp. PAMC28666]|uniref:BrnT family toxin n=1 Tax=Glaciimonas sp. PAMC28666 TaxID=2807626 RepID=UPI001963FA83|nr:BrnT family toxin [Glaciimonas sp. PAMC28666]QRX80891.1 BrnT family toxin [Glaciimonas sp. PAMC28666]
MDITFDTDKNERNIRDRDLSFEQAADFDFATAEIALDERNDYGEERYIAVGYLGQRLHVLCFTESNAGIRVISFRKANLREGKIHEKPLTFHQ